MSMFHDIDLNRAGNEQMCINNAQQVCLFLQRFRARSLVPRSARARFAGSRGKWDAIAEKMTDVVAQLEHPAFPTAEI